MAARKVLLVALATQTALILLSWWFARLLYLPPQWGGSARDVILGLGTALALAAINYWLLTRAPAGWMANGVRSVYHDTIVPIFGALGPLSAITIGIAAGVGEEWFFRGIIQPLAGMPVASVLFGLAHSGSRRLLPFGVWATGMGLVMGGLTSLTGGLAAAMLAHGVYDVLALEYIRRTSHRPHISAERGAHTQ